MTSIRSMADVAYDVLASKKRSVQFNKLWSEVCKITGANNNKVSQFYSDLTLDSRFVCLKDNKWDLIERRKYNESHVDISKIELEEDEPEEVEDDGSELIIEKNEYEDS